MTPSKKWIYIPIQHLWRYGIQWFFFSFWVLFSYLVFQIPCDTKIGFAPFFFFFLNNFSIASFLNTWCRKTNNFHLQMHIGTVNYLNHFFFFWKKFQWFSQFLNSYTKVSRNPYLVSQKRRRSNPFLVKVGNSPYQISDLYSFNLNDTIRLWIIIFLSI